MGQLLKECAALAAIMLGCALAAGPFVAAFLEGLLRWPRVEYPTPELKELARKERGRERLIGAVFCAVGAAAFYYVMRK
jgi:hypothetical protein